MRSFLKTGTVIKVSGDIIYKITDGPIGEGGGSIIYPALRMLPDQDGYKVSHISYAVKECYPQSSKFVFFRGDHGTIRPNEDDPEAQQYLDRAKEMQKKEEVASGRIYAQGFRLTPVIEAYRHEEISFDDGASFLPAENLISIMESLSGKGDSLKHSLSERKHLQARDTFNVIRQVLFAVNEVHKNGFLHLDIQDGNVFIKGVLDKNDSMISLIDFGSARALLPDGMCAEISDKVLYSTQGFTAPEILEKNDGHLRLGKETDIYSIGALALLLLTGHRYTTRELMENTNGKYIPRFAIRKTACPAHLIDKMQGIIAKALKNDPAERYQSCDDMLVDVDEMLALLAPHTDPLSATDYDAFICYKHSEKDNAAARALRDSLEHYRDSFRSKRKIKKVFLDEGEFSSCSDFGERINTALKNSQWLIVLCSKQTKESVWVNDEIKTFLKYHDKSRLLAVITEGEPDEVYPQELIKNGFSAKTLFAADARADDEKGVLTKIKGDVRLQIAAPILNTTFDALKQRDRLYKMRRTFGATAAVLGVLAVFLSYAAIKANQIARQEKEIVKEQNEKLDSQAALLAKQAQEAYDAQNYPDAMRLALSSIDLSDDNQDQISQLKSILISCLNLYVRPEEAALLVYPTGVISEEGAPDIEEFFTNQDGSRLFVISDKDLSVWDTDKCSKISSFHTDTDIVSPAYYRWEDCLIDDKEQFIVCTEDVLVSYSYGTKEVNWSLKEEEQAFKTEMIVMSEDHSHLYRMGFSYDDEAAFIEDIDPATGKVIEKHRYEGDYKSAFGRACIVSPDNRYVVSVGGNTGDSHPADRIDQTLFVFDLKDNTAVYKTLWSVDPWGSQTTTDILFTEAGNVVVSSYDGAVNIHSSLDDEQAIDLVGLKSFKICCCDVKSAEILWEKDSSKSDATGEPVKKDLRGLTYPVIFSAQVQGTDAVVAGFGNTLWVINAETGDLTNTLEFDTLIVSINPTKEKGYNVILADGSLLYVFDEFERDSVGQFRSFPNGIASACHYQGTFYVQKESDLSALVKYEMNKYDESYTEEFVKGTTPADYVKGLGSDDSIRKQDGVSLEISDDKTSFVIKADKEKTVKVGEAIGAVSFIPDQDEILVGLADQVRLYSISGKLIAQAELPLMLYSTDLSGQLFFLEDGSCLYGDRYAGYLIDINKNSLYPVKYMKYVAGFDHENNEFILCNSGADEKGGATVGHIQYHSFKEIKELAKKTIK